MRTPPPDPCERAEQPSGCAYSTPNGRALVGDSLELLGQLEPGSVDLVITSPPFALQRQKAYGNEEQAAYVEWLCRFAREAHRVLRETGSFVIDIGGAYERGAPSRSLYNFRALIAFCDDVGFHLAQDFYWYNPSRLPSPIEWVNKRKVRVKDAVNTVWWLSKTPWPHADVTQVLTPYSERMKQLLRDPERFYKPKKRPSGHAIGTSFAHDNGGAIPPNLLQIPNSESNGLYLQACKATGVQGHPARFPAKLPEFFIKMLTRPGDLVVDIFAGSNTTGQVAEGLERRWIAMEQSREYVAASAFRFVDSVAACGDVHARILAGETVVLPGSACGARPVSARAARPRA